ncbi:MAG TPA: hypothetical protein ACFYD7_13115 [Candidatus Wujingus californicus]|uniref:hypothetical protein n=1 Tax=Candidatus Wujingus californicus TaxID=3367618 RepID=UPI004029FC65
MFFRNWLTVYTSSPCPELEIEGAAGYLINAANRSPEELKHQFDLVFALAGRSLVVIEGQEFKILPVVQ